MLPHVDLPPGGRIPGLMTGLHASGPARVGNEWGAAGHAGNESHAGQVFVCVAALHIADALHLLDADLLCWWWGYSACSIV